MPPTPARGAGARMRSRLLAEDRPSLSARARARRAEELLARFPDLANRRVIDLGGTVWHWQSVPVRPEAVLVVNIDADSLADPPSWIDTLQADVCDLPASTFDSRFDLAYSNSVIEHVGGHRHRLAFAAAVRRLSTHHWVQTPARSFPIEPHWVFPGFQFLPVALRAEVSRRWPLAPPGFRGRTRAQAVDDALGVELLSMTEMVHLFPDSEIYRERLAGLTKSMVAIA